MWSTGQRPTTVRRSPKAVHRAERHRARGEVHRLGHKSNQHEDNDMLLQHGDTLWYRDRAFDLMDEPLEAYFTLISSRPDFVRSSAASRGYVANWAVQDGWLYLTAISALWQDGTPVRLEHLFPFGGDQVFAAWYSGQLRAYRSDASPLSLSSIDRSPDLVINVHCGRLQASSMIHRPAAKLASRAVGGARVIDLKARAEAG
jgi:hypothetical protein